MTHTSDPRLVTAFKRLPTSDLRRLMWHVKERTPICCEDKSDEFTDYKGAG